MLMVALMIIMCVVIFIATIARFTNLFIIVWAEELARYCMIWVIFLGIGAAAESGEHFCVEALELFCPKKILDIITVVKAVLVFLFSGFVSYYAFTILQKQMAGGQITPSLRWPMWTMYLAIPLGLIIMSLCYAYHAYEKLAVKDEGKEENAV